MKTAIKTLIQNGSAITTGYKKHVKHWYQDSTISIYDNKCIVSGGVPRREFDNIDEGIQFYIDEVLSGKNLGYVWKRITAKGIDIENNLDEHTGTFGDYQQTYDEAVKAEKKLIKAEMKNDN